MEQNMLYDIFQAVDILVDKKLEKSNFDKTIECTITDDSNSANGEYYVTDSASVFSAYSKDKYGKNDVVYVMTPFGGDKKIIIGKVPNKSSFLSASISEDYNEQTENIVKDSNIFSLLANGDNIDLATNYIEKITKNKLAEINNIDIGDNTKMLIKGLFKTSFGATSVNSGDYGIEVIIYYDNTSKSFVLNSSDMSNNPYAFEKYCEEYIVCDITDIETINKIELYFYQKGNFKNLNDNYIPFGIFDSDNSFIKYNNNLFVKDCYISFGINAEYNKNSFMTYKQTEQLISDSISNLAKLIGPGF